MIKNGKKSIIISTFLCISTLIVGVVVNQWNNAQAIYEAVIYSEEEIQFKRDETQKEVNKVLEEYDIMQVEPLSQTMIDQLVSGELSTEALTKEIIQNQHLTEVLYEEESVEIEFSSEQLQINDMLSDEKDSTQSQEIYNVVSEQFPTQIKEGDKQTASVLDEQVIINYYVTQVYILQAKYEGLLEVLKDRGIAILKNIPTSERSLANLTQAGLPLIQEAYVLEDLCNNEMKVLLDKLEDELKAIEKDTNIIQVIQSAYESEKSLKKAYYISLAKSML